jgi:hypothetical protein
MILHLFGCLYIVKALTFFYIPVTHVSRVERSRARLKAVLEQLFKNDCPGR